MGERSWSRLVLLLAIAAASGCSKTELDRVDQLGGVIAREADGYGARAVFPAGALRRSTSIRLSNLDRLPPGAVGPAVELEPHGARFDRPVAVRFKPRREQLAEGVHYGQLRVATLEDGAWKLLRTRFPEPGVIEGETLHFSTFALVNPCFASGTGADFPLFGCPVFNPRITSSSPLTLQAWAGAVSLNLRVRAASGAAATTLTVTGLRSGWTYYLLRLATGIETPLQSSAQGELSFAADAAAGERLLLMARPGTSVVNEAVCRYSWGTWDAGTRNCTMPADIVDTPLIIGASNFTLDCAGHTIGSPTDVSALGVLFNGANIRIKNCNIKNSDTGVESAHDGTAIESTLFENTIGAAGLAVRLDHLAGASLQGVTARSMHAALSADTVTGLQVSSSRFTTWAPPVFLSTTTGTISSLTLDGEFSGPGSPDPDAEASPGAIQVANFSDISLSGLQTVGPMTAFTSVVSIFFDSVGSVRDSSISVAREAVRIDGPGVGEVSGNTLSGNRVGLALNGGTNHVFHNNFVANSERSVTSPVAVELSDARPASATYQRGNYWGRSCPGGLFIPGTDTSSSSVIDSYPYGAPSAWSAGGNPGCTALPPLTAPVLTAPSPGQLLATPRPIFRGVGTPGSTVEVLEGTSVIATASVAANSTFAASARADLAQGGHTVVARATLGAQTSPPSPPLNFSVDSLAPSAPSIAAPLPGQVVADVAPVVRGATEPGARVWIREAAALLGVATADSAGSYSAPLLTLSPGSHTIDATAIDAAGNLSVRSLGVSFSFGCGSSATTVGRVISAR